MILTLKQFLIGILIIMFFIGTGYVLAEAFNKRFCQPKEETSKATINNYSLTH